MNIIEMIKKLPFFKKKDPTIIELSKEEIVQIEEKIEVPKEIEDFFNGNGQYYRIKNFLIDLIGGKRFRFYGFTDDKKTMLLESLENGQGTDKIFVLSEHTNRYHNKNYLIMPFNIGNKTINDDIDNIISITPSRDSDYISISEIIKINEGIIYVCITPSIDKSSDAKNSSMRFLSSEVCFYINKRVNTFRNANKPLKEFLNHIILYEDDDRLSTFLQPSNVQEDLKFNFTKETYQIKNHYKAYELALNKLLLKVNNEITSGNIDYDKEIIVDPYANYDYRYPEEIEDEKDRNISRDNIKGLSLERLKNICPATMKRLVYECNDQPAKGSNGDMVNEFIKTDEEKALYLYEKLGMYSWYCYFNEIIEYLVKEGKYNTILDIYDILFKRINNLFYQKVKSEIENWTKAVCDHISQLKDIEFNKTDFFNKIIAKMQNANIEDEFVKRLVLIQIKKLEHYRDNKVHGVKEYKVEDFNTELSAPDNDVEPLNNMPTINYSRKSFENKFGNWYGNKLCFASGTEGVLFKLSDDELAKIFRYYMPNNPFGCSAEYRNEIVYGEAVEKTLKRKRKKLELLYELAKGLPVSVPLKLITIDDEFVGYTMELVNDELGNFEKIRQSNMSLEERIALLLIAEDNIRQLHDRGIGLGDLNETNFVGKNAIITDFDNASVGGLRCDLFPLYMRYYRNVVKKCDMPESDMFSFSITALSMLTDIGVHNKIVEDVSSLENLSFIVSLIPDEYKDLRDYFTLLLDPTTKNEYITPVLKSLTLKPNTKKIEIDKKYFLH